MWSDRLRRWARHWAPWGVPVLLASWGVWRICDIPQVAADPALVETAPSGPPSLTAPVSTVFALGRSDPTQLVIPAINVRSRLDRVGLGRDGTIETPPYSRASRAAWYHVGPAPGEIGAAVILGHFDAKTTKDRKAVFFRLRELKPGAEVAVSRADGNVAVFVVDSVERFAKAAFPLERVYGQVGYPALRLITCGGRFDGKRREYLDNIVVFAHLTTARSAP